MGAARGEGVHVEILLLVRLLAVDDRDLVLREREGLHDFLIAPFQVLVVHFLAFENQRVNDEDLASQGDLVAHELVERIALVLAELPGDDGLPSGRHLVDDGDVEVAVQGHRQGAGDRRRGHDEDVRGNAVRPFGPEAGTLVHAETVLLVDDGEAEAPEDDVVLDEGVGADDQADGAVPEAGVDFAPGCDAG